MTNLRLYNLLYKCDFKIQMDNTKRKVTYSKDAGTKWSITLNKNHHKMSIHGQVPNKVLALCTKYNNTRINRRNNSIYDLLGYLYIQILKTGKEYGYTATCGGFNHGKIYKWNLRCFELLYDGEYALYHPDEYADDVLIDSRKDNRKIIMNINSTYDSNVSIKLPKELNEDISEYFQCLDEIVFRKSNHDSMLLYSDDMNGIYPLNI